MARGADEANAFRARYYDPKAGRLLSEDPIGMRGGLNLFSYVRNNPLRYVDPTGEIKWRIKWKTDYWYLSSGLTVASLDSITWECTGGDCGGGWRTEFTVSASITMHISSSCPAWSLAHETRHALLYTTNIMQYAGPPLRAAEGTSYSTKAECEAKSRAAAATAGAEVAKHFDDGQWKIDFGYIPCVFP